MKIGITGDTHGNVQAMRKLLQATPPVELWLHTGDHADDANLLATMTKLPVIRVLGNCDMGTRDAKIDEMLELEGFHVWLTHGHRYIERNERADLGYWAKQLGQDIVIFGHTHVPICEYYGDTLLLNPGSPARPRGGSESCFAVLTLQAGKTPEVEYITLPEPQRSLF